VAGYKSEKSKGKARVVDAGDAQEPQPNRARPVAPQQPRPPVFSFAEAGPSRRPLRTIDYRQVSRDEQIARDLQEQEIERAHETPEGNTIDSLRQGFAKLWSMPAVQKASAAASGFMSSFSQQLNPVVTTDDKSQIDRSAIGGKSPTTARPRPVIIENKDEDEADEKVLEGPYDPVARTDVLESLPSGDDSMSEPTQSSNPTTDRWADRDSSSDEEFYSKFPSANLRKRTRGRKRKQTVQETGASSNPAPRPPPSSGPERPAPGLTGHDGFRSRHAVIIGSNLPKRESGLCFFAFERDLGLVCHGLRSGECTLAHDVTDQLVQHYANARPPIAWAMVREQRRRTREAQLAAEAEFQRRREKDRAAKRGNRSGTKSATTWDADLSRRAKTMCLMRHAATDATGALYGRLTPSRLSTMAAVKLLEMVKTSQATLTWTKRAGNARARPRSSTPKGGNSPSSGRFLAVPWSFLWPFLGQFHDRFLVIPMAASWSFPWPHRCLLETRVSRLTLVTVGIIRSFHGRTVRYLILSSKSPS
jgi:hypothetical protein